MNDHQYPDPEVAALLQTLNREPEAPVRPDLAEHVITMHQHQVQAHRRRRWVRRGAIGAAALALIAVPATAIAGSSVQSLLAGLTDDGSSANANNLLDGLGPEGSKIEMWSYANPSGGTCEALAITAGDAQPTTVTDDGCGKNDVSTRERDSGAYWAKYRWLSPAGNWYVFTYAKNDGDMNLALTFADSNTRVGTVIVNGHELAYWGEQESDAARVIVTIDGDSAGLVPLDMKRIWSEVVLANQS